MQLSGGVTVQPTSEQATPTSEQAIPTSEQATLTSEQATLTSEQATPTAQQAFNCDELPAASTNSEAFDLLDIPVSGHAAITETALGKYLK